MIKNKNLIYSLVTIAGIILVWFVYADQGIERTPEISGEESPLILVDGKVPPRLSNFVMHMQYIDENTCLKCHKDEREMNFGSGPVLAKKMPHEMRENCVSCHLLPK
ncbi:MAG: hypothetical protein ISR89_00720 [Candidatus Marinimicrobia bacterium]|nr:hypothetical protein [Candidatus Neomarinimicrobiota bacterium]MBL7029674.1 hypothetical protein [Candidatus Neomarinimicrobiota bacterium]